MPACLLSAQSSSVHLCLDLLNLIVSPRFFCSAFPKFHSYFNPTALYRLENEWFFCGLCCPFVAQWANRAIEKLHSYPLCLPCLLLWSDSFRKFLSPTSHCFMFFWMLLRRVVCLERTSEFSCLCYESLFLNSVVFFTMLLSVLEDVYVPLK